MIVPSTLNDQECMLYNQMLDLRQRVDNNYAFEETFYFNPRELAIAQTAVKTNYFSFGGYSEAERKRLLIYPPGWEFSDNDSSIRAVKIIHQNTTTLNHRWVLGSLINLGIARGNIGDIIPFTGYCTVLTTDVAYPVILDELNRVGSVGVKTEEMPLCEIISNRQYRDLSGTVSSLRMDSLVALLVSSSRGKIEPLFAAGKIQKNYQVIEKPSTDFDVNDVISVRGYGKYIVDSVGKPTRKCRLPIKCRKYIN